jgi:hypothetical protein
MSWLKTLLGLLLGKGIKLSYTVRFGGGKKRWPK